MTGRPPSDQIPPPWRRALPRALFRLLLLAALIAAAVGIQHWIRNLLDAQHSIAPMPIGLSVLIIALICYALLLAIPFMPGVELGIGLLLLGGAPVAPFVYLATVAGLSLAFLLGHLVPLAWLHRFFRDLHLMRACAWIEQIRKTSPEERLADMRTRLPRWLAPFLVNYRYVMLGLLVNLPGSFVIGGGGGILMVAGLSRLFSPPAIVLTLALATLPVPLAYWLWGPQAIAGLL